MMKFLWWDMLRRKSTVILIMLFALKLISERKSIKYILFVGNILSGSLNFIQCVGKCLENITKHRNIFLS